MGQKITKDTVLGTMGNTGIYSTGVHLHLEIDTDTNEKYACWSPTVSSTPGQELQSLRVEQIQRLIQAKFYLRNHRLPITKSRY